MPTPTQVLGLLPPEASWPEGFGLAAANARCRDVQTTAPGTAMAPARRYAAAPGGYPAHRRATRLSYGIFAIIGGVDQAVVAAPSAVARLRLASRRLAALCKSV